MKRHKMVPTTVERVVEKVTEEKETVVDDGVDAFTSLMGKEVCILCAGYIYSGKLTGVNGESILLTDCSIIYETGPWSNKNWKDSQKLPMKETFLQKGMVEAFGELVR